LSLAVKGGAGELVAAHHPQNSPVEGEYIRTIPVLANASQPVDITIEPANSTQMKFPLDKSPETQRRNVFATPSALGPLHLK
jgi:hypothetical protein